MKNIVTSLLSNLISLVETSLCPLDEPCSFQVSDPGFNETICRFFSYSLDDRIIPRHKALVENRVNFKLRYMLAISDEEFARRVEAAVERRSRFESGLMSSTLSDSQTTNDSLENRTLVDFCGSEVAFSECQTSENQVSSSKNEDALSISSE